MGTEAEAGARQVQAKERQGGQDPGEAGRGKDGQTLPWRLQREPGPVITLTLDFSNHREWSC